MKEGLYLPEGVYRVPNIGPRLKFNDYPEAQFFVQDGELGIKSILQGQNILFSEAFQDRRAFTLVDTIVRHQFHHFDTRQLSLPERFETRDGVGRMDRLTTLVESAVLVTKLGGTFEQVAQVMMSDINVTVDSHRIGDHLEGDYINEATRDDDIVDYAYNSGLHDALVQAGAVDIDGYLAGSPVELYDLANPNTPRRFDIAECPRPDGNADRTPFTLIEGVYLVDHTSILDAVKSIIRVEVPSQVNGGTEERMGFNDRNAARLLYQLSVRHATEHWGELNHKIISELLSMGDRHRFISGSNEYSPIDYARTAESDWYRQAEENQFNSLLNDVVQQLSQVMKTAQMPVQQGGIVYEGPLDIPGVEYRFVDEEILSYVKIERESRRSPKGYVELNVPRHKIRQPIDSWVVDARGCNRISDLEPSLKKYADRQQQWLGSAVARVAVDWNVLGDLQVGIRNVQKVWHEVELGQKPEPMRRPAMPKNVLSGQINRARNYVIEAAHRPTSI